MLSNNPHLMIQFVSIAVLLMVTIAFILVGVTVAFSKSETDTYPTSAETVFAFVPFARYYIHTSNEQFVFFGQASVMFVFGSGRMSFLPRM